MWCVSLALAGSAWVTSSVAIVRDRPDGQQVHRLRIGTELEVSASEGAWQQVRLPGRPDAHPVAGWIRSDLLGAAPPDLDALLASSSDPVAAERALALAPHDLRARLAWADAHGRVLPEDDAAFVAVCTGGRAVVVGALEGDRLRSWVGEPEPAMKRLARRLATEAWYTGDTPLLGTPFPTPFLTAIDNEEPSSAFVPGISLLGSGETWKIVLGPCEGDVVYTTRPQRPQASAPLDDAAPLLASALTRSRDRVWSGRAWRPVEDVPWSMVELVEDVHPHTCGGELEGWVKVRSQAVVDAHGEVLLSLGQTEVDRWIQVDGRPLGVSWYRTLTDEGVTLVLGERQPTSQFVSLSYWGC